MHTAIASRAKHVQSADKQGKSLTVIPILGPSHRRPAYELLRQETLPAVKVTEVSDSGSVPELRVTNELDVRAYLMDGQELLGAKQNRILNTDVLIPAKTTISIPVSCVEQGRWRRISPHFSSSGHHASHRIRAAKMRRIHDALKQRNRHDADQGAIWQEVEAALASSGTDSPTSALNDAYTKRDRELMELRQSLKMPAAAVGLAVLHGNTLLGLDLFDRHSTLVYFWESLVDSYAIEYLAAPVDPSQPERGGESKVIRSLLDRAAGGKWEPFDPPGEGKDWRLEDEQFNGSALVWDEKVVIHLQLFPKQAVQS